MVSRPDKHKKVSSLLSWTRNPASSTSQATKSAPDDSSSFSSIDKRTPEAIRQQLVRTWQTVWEGLYQQHPRASCFRIDELRFLCYGAGATLDEARANQLLGSLDDALAHGHSHSPGLRYIQLEKNTSTQHLDALFELLNAYIAEIEVVDKLEALLRDAQVGLREPKMQDWEPVKQAIPPLVESAGRKISHYNARLHLLQLDIEKEAYTQRPDKAPEWVTLESLAYPGKHMSSTSFMR